jgi:hypothetical protein
MFCGALVRVLVIYLRRLVPESFRHFFFPDIISLKTKDIAVFRLRQPKHRHSRSVAWRQTIRIAIKGSQASKLVAMVKPKGGSAPVGGQDPTLSYIFGANAR